MAASLGWPMPPAWQQSNTSTTFRAGRAFRAAVNSPPEVAERVRSTAARIRERVKQTLEAIIEVGNDLLEVKKALPHGQFGQWLGLKCGWTECTARNFMAVAERFGPKTEIISDLTIQPTAAYLLAAPSVPDEAGVHLLDAHLLFEDAGVVDQVREGA
jgi:hypothetical protein